MKKFFTKCIYPIGVLIFISSCQKPQDWDCTCDCTPIGGSSFSQTTKITNTKKNDANSKCSDFGKALVNGNGTWKCKIS